ncbi:MAG: iron-containing alcohol dehydrogenase [Caldisericia bacterium]
MINFTQYNPVKIVFGPGEIKKIGEQAKTLGNKPLVVFGMNSAKETGLDEKCFQLLKEAGLEPIPFYGIEPNPRESTCDKAAEHAKTNNCDFVIGVGGGSVMDASKTIAASASTGKPVWSHVKMGEPVTSALPIMTVSTLAATGSEFNAGAVITNWETNEKLGLFSPHMFPKISILDPELSITTPPNHTAYGGVDIMIHVLETYLTSNDNYTPVQDGISEAIMKTVVEYLPKAFSAGDDINSRSQLSWASAVALCGIPNNGRPGGFLMHWMEHVMSAHHDIPHGLGLSFLLPPTLEYISEAFPKDMRCF